MVWYPKIYTIKKKGSTGTEFPFPSGRCSIGGDSTCDIQIRGAGLAHCLLVVDKNKQAHVINVAGTKDVLRNDEHVPNEAFLSHGDIVTVGSRQFRFEWALTQKKGETLAPPSSNGTRQSKGGTRESSTSKDDAEKESLTAQQAPGTPGVSTPTTSFFDQSFHKTPCIPPEDFVSPLSTSNLSDVGHQSERPSRSRSAVAYGAARNGQGVVRAKRLSWSDGVPYSPSDVSDVSSPRKLLRAKQSSISTNFAVLIQEVSSPKGCNGSGIVPVAESPVGEQLYNSSDSTPLIDEPRMRAMRSRGSLASMSDTSTEDERSVSLRRQSKGPVKRRRSSQIVAEGQSPKLKKQNYHEDVQDTSLASHNGCDGQLVAEKSLIKNSVEECSIHIKGLATSGTANGILIASTPVAGVNTRASRMETGSARKSKTLLRQAQKNRSVYSTPQLSNSYLASNAASPELSFLTTRSGSRMALRSFKGNESADGSQTSSISDGTLGCELLFETPGSSFNLSSTNTRENGIVHDMSVSSAHCEPTHQSSVDASPATQTSLLCDSGRRRRAALPKMSEQNEVQQLETVGTSSKRVGLHSMVGLKSSQTPASKKVDDEVPGCGVSGTPNASSASKTKRTSISKRSDKQEDVDTVQSLKASGTKRTPASRKTKKEEAPGLESVSTSFPAQANADNMDVSQENSFRSGGASASGDPELVAMPTSLNTSRAKRTSTSKKLNKETTKQEQSGTPKSVKILGAGEGTPTASHVDEKLQQSSASVSSFKDESANGIDIAMGESVISARSPRSGRVSASRTPASRKPSEKISEWENVSTPINKLTEVTDKIGGVDMQLVVGNENNGQTPLENKETALEESFRLRSRRSSRTPASNVGRFDTPGLVAAGSPNSSTASKVEQTPGLKKTDRRDTSRNNGVDTSLVLSTSGRKETVASPMVEDFEQQAACASPFTLERVDVAMGKSVRRRRSSHMPDALNISSAKSTPVSTNANDSTREEVVNTAHSKRISICKQTPTSNKAMEETNEDALCMPQSARISGSKRTSALKKVQQNDEAADPKSLDAYPLKHVSSDSLHDIPGESARTKCGRMSHVPAVKSVNADVLDQDRDRTSSTLNTSRATRMRASMSEETTKQDVAGAAKNLRASGAKHTPASKKLTQEMDSSDKESVNTTPLKHESTGDTDVAMAESIKKRHLWASRTPASGKVNAGASQEEALEAPNILNVSATPTNIEEKATGQRTRSRVSSALATSDSAFVAVEESTRKRSSRFSHTEKLSTEMLEQNIVITPSTDSASTAVQMPVSINEEATEQNTRETPKTARAAKVKQTSGSAKANKRTPQHDMGGTSPSKDAVPDSVTAAVEGSARARRGRCKSTPVSKEAYADVLEQEAPCIPDVLDTSAVKHTPASRKTSKETAKQQVPGTPHPSRISQTQEQAQNSKHASQEQDDSEQETICLSPYKQVDSDNRDVAMEESVRTKDGKPSRTPVSRKHRLEVSQQDKVATPCAFDASGADSTSASAKIKETIRQDMVDSPQSCRSLRVKRTPAPKEVNVEQKGPARETVGSSPSKQIISEDVIGEMFVVRRSARASGTAIAKGDVEEIKQDKIVGSPNKSISVTKQVPFVGEQNTTTEQKPTVASVKRAKCTPNSATVHKEVVVSAQMSGHEPSSEFVSNSNDVPVQESVRSARGRSSCTLPSRNVSVGSSEPEVILVEQQSMKANRAEKQEVVGTPKSPKVSGSKQKHASGKVREEEGDAQHEVAELQSSKGTDVAAVGFVVKESARASGTLQKAQLDALDLEAPNTQSSSRSKRTVVSKKVNNKVMESDKTGTPKLKAVKSRRTPASGNLNDQDKVSEQELKGMPPSEHATPDVTDATVEQTTIRSARSRRTPASRCMDADVPKSEAVGTPSSSKAKQTPILKTTSEHLEHDTTDTLSCSKAAGAKEMLASGKMEEKEETSSEMDTVNVVLEDSTVPVRSTRLRRAVASRKVNVEVFEQDSAGQPHPKKASRVKRALASKKVHEDDGHGSPVEPFKENMVLVEKEPVQSPVQVRRKRTAALKQQKKDENYDPTDTSSSQQKPEQELEDEAVAHPPTTTTGRGRGKRALASQEEPVGTQLSTVEDDVGAIKKKRGRQPKDVVVDVLEQNGAEELSTKVGKSSKSTKSRRIGSSKQEQNDGAPASDPSHNDEAMLPASLRRSKRKAVEMTAPVIDHATVEVTPKKTRGRRAKAVESTNTDEQGSTVKALKNGQPDEVPPARRTRKRV